MSWLRLEEEDVVEGEVEEEEVVEEQGEVLKVEVHHREE